MGVRKAVLYNPEIPLRMRYRILENNSLTSGANAEDGAANCLLAPAASGYLVPVPSTREVCDPLWRLMVPG